MARHRPSTPGISADSAKWEDGNQKLITKRTCLRRAAWAPVLVLIGVVGACGQSPGANPENDHYKRLPEPCTLIDHAAISETLGESATTDSNQTGSTAYCTWTHRNMDSEGARPFERILSLHVTFHRSNEALSGSDAALQQLIRFKKHSPDSEDVHGIGEKSMKVETAGGAEYVFMTGNLNASLTFEGSDATADGKTIPISREEAGKTAHRLTRDVAAALKPHHA